MAVISTSSNHRGWSRFNFQLSFAHPRDDGGVGRHVVHGRWEREQVGQQGEYVVWGFPNRQSQYVWWKDEVTTCHRRDNVSAKEKKQGITTATDFFRRFGTLTDLGLIEWVTYLCESQDPDAEIIHPFGWGPSNSPQLQDQIGLAAHQAGCALLTEGQCEFVVREELRVCPVRRHFAEATLVDIARLTYRPRTSATSQWWEEHHTDGAKCLDGYRSILQRATSRDFKVAQ